MKQLNLSRAETEGYTHLLEIQGQEGERHNVNSCPPGTRQRCPHANAVTGALSKMRRADKVVDVNGVVLKDRNAMTGVRP